MNTSRESWKRRALTAENELERAHADLRFISQGLANHADSTRCAQGITDAEDAAIVRLREALREVER